jgi:hypothetical protein
MVPARGRLAAALLVMLLTASVAVRPARAVAFELNDAGWEGCAELLDLARTELGRDRVVVVATIDWEQLGPSDGIMLLHPLHSLDPEEAAAFMRAGGRLAVLDDYGRGDRLLEHFKIHRRALPSYPAQYLRGKPSLPIALPAVDSAGQEVLGLHPTVADVKQVVLNHGTGLRHPDLTPVLEVRGQRDGVASGPGETVTVAVAGQVDKGRLFAMGDPSAFINLMLRYPGNRRFAVGLVHYLADGDAVDPRKGRLYIVANEFGEGGSFGGVTPLRKALDRKLQALLEAFEELRDRGFPWWLHVAVAALSALAVLWWVARAMVRMYRSRLPRFAKSLPLAAQGGVAGRVAVLASPVAPPALALLELKSALCEALAQALGLAQATPGQLLDELGKRAPLDPDLGARAARALGLMRAAEYALMGGGGMRVSKAQVAEAAEVVRAVVQKAGVPIRARAPDARPQQPRSGS